MTDKRLLPCPFCGGEVEFHPQEHHMENFWNKNTIHCPTCGFLMEETSRLQLFKKWNTRKPMERIAERLEERADCLLKDFVLANKAIEVKQKSMCRIEELRGAIEIVKGGGVDE